MPGADPTGAGDEVAGAGSAGAEGGKGVAEEEDWEKEEGYLQTLVDKLQDKVDKEIARTLKVGPPFRPDVWASEGSAELTCPLARADHRV